VPSSKQGTISLRDKTPDSPARSRALEPTVFQSPIRSFSHATAETKERKRRKFVGNDEDSDEEMAPGGTRSDVQDDKMNDIESQLGWVTDGSDKGKSRRRKSDKTGANNVKVMYPALAGSLSSYQCRSQARNKSSRRRRKLHACALVSRGRCSFAHTSQSLREGSGRPRKGCIRAPVVRIALREKS
jgi:hypothetical protein